MPPTPAPPNHSIWFAYFGGFALTLLFKWAKYVYFAQKNDKKKIGEATFEWFLEPSLSNASSWTATVGGVWILGSIYIKRIVHITGLTDLPLDASIAFFLGTIFEFTVPAITKWLVGKIPTS